MRLRFGVLLMTENTPAELIADARAKFEKAHDELIRILSVDEQVRMTIPADQANDTDLVIVAALDAGRSLADTLAALSRPVPDDTETKANREASNNSPDGLLVDRHVRKSGIKEFGDAITSAFPASVPVTGGVDLEAIEARANAATEGPWQAEIGEDIEVNAGTARTVWNEKGDVGTPARSWRSSDRILEVSDAEWELPEDDYAVIAANAEFIAHAREDIPALVAEIRALRSRLSPPTREAPSVHDLAGSHAAYHDQRGNMLYDGDCIWEKCPFWEVATHLLDDLRLASSPETEGEKN